MSNDAVQLLLFEETHDEKMHRKMNKIETEVGNIRRGIFQRHNDLLGMILSLQDEVKSLKKGMSG
jgi:hypothetical protein